MAALLKRIVFAPSKYLSPSSSFSSPTSSSPSEQSALISAVVSLLTHHRSKSRWTHLRSLLLSTATTTTLTPIVFSQIALQLKSNPRLALRFFHFTLRHSLCTHNLRSYSTVIHILSRARLRTLARSVIRAALGSPEVNNSTVKLFEVLVKTYRECDSAPFVFDLLIKACLDLKKIDGSIQIVRMLKSRGIRPQISTCNSLISSVSRCRGSYEGYGVFRDLFGSEDGEMEGEVKRDVRVRPNVHSFNALMVGFYRDGDMEMVEEIWSEMESFGCVANAYSYSVLMAMVCEGGRMGELEKIWEEMKVKGIKPDLVAYNTIIGRLCNIGEIEKAEGFVREMGLCGLDSSCATFEHLIGGYCKVGNLDSALLVYKDMIRKDFRLETCTMDVLIGGLCENNRVFEALEIMRNAMRDTSFYPSRKSYELLITELCENKRIKEALKLQAQMIGKGYEPNSKVYSAFIEGYAKIGNEDMVAMLRVEMSEMEKRQKDD